jgi:hypothetical protein
MATRHDPPNHSAELLLTAFELPKWIVEPAHAGCSIPRSISSSTMLTVHATPAKKDASMLARGERDQRVSRPFMRAQSKAAMRIIEFPPHRHNG